MQKVKGAIKNFFPALNSYNYRLYFMGQGISLVGTWFASIAQQWLIYPTLTNNSSLLGIISAANMIPTAILVLFTGVIADRVNRRATVILVQALFAIITFWISVLVFTGRIEIWHVFVSSILSGIIFAFDMPTRNALVLDFLDRKYLPSALSLNTGIFNAARAIGPALAGITIATIGIAPAYLIDSISFLAVIISLYMLKLPPHVHEKKSVSLLNGLKEGISYVKTNKITAILLYMTFIVTFFSWPASVLQPVFAHDIFNRGEIGFGLMQSFYGIGAMIGAFGFSRIFEKTKDIFKFMNYVSIAFVVSYAVFAFSPSFYVSLAVLMVMGWVIASMYAAINILLQLYIPTQMRGRMMGFYSFMIFTGIPLAGLLVSALTHIVSPRAIILGSVILFSFANGALLLLLGKKIGTKLNEIVMFHRVKEL